jgi:phosphoglycolate phosphatase
MIDKYKAVLFDFDFTLCDSSAGQSDSVNYALGKLVGLSLEDIFQQLTSNSLHENKGLFRKHFTDRADVVIAPSSVMFSGVDTLFKLLRSKDKKIGIVSTKYRYRIEEILSNHSLRDQVDIIIGGEDVKNYKPDPEPMLIALDRLGLQNHEVLYIGDSTVDAEVALASGVDFIAVLSGKTLTEEFEPYKPHAILQGVHELINYSGENKR